MAARVVLLALATLAVVLMAAMEPASLRALGWLPARLPFAALSATVAVWAMATVIEVVWMRRGLATESSNAVHLAVDVLALTALLMATGGVRNPFTTLYFVPLTLATQVSARSTWGVAALTTASFASMFAYPGMGPAGVGPHAQHFAGHMRGMWFAFAAAGALMTLFVHRIARALDSQRAELERLRRRAMEDQHLAAVGALAAGAAHELGTPLGSVSLLSEELPHLQGPERDEALAAIRHELQRAKTILHRMRGPVPTLRPLPDDEAWPLRELSALAEMPPGEPQVRWAYEASAGDAKVQVSELMVGQVLRELLLNAARATASAHPAADPAAPSSLITVSVRAHNGQAEIEVRDQGSGMDAETLASAFEPLSTTRPEGMGLGLFLARGHARAVGGELRIESAAGRGTRATLTLPLSIGGAA